MFSIIKTVVDKYISTVVCIEYSHLYDNKISIVVHIIYIYIFFFSFLLII